MHRDGVVGRQDVRAGDCLRVMWRALEVGYREPGSEDRSAISAPFRVEAGGVISAGFVTRTRSFQLGEEVRLGHRELYDSFMTFYIFVSTLVQSIQAYGRDIGALSEDKLDTPVYVT